MIMDGLLMFDNANAITVTRDSTNTIDILNARDMGIGQPVLWLLCQPTTTFTAGGAATLVIEFQGSPDNSAWTTMAQSAAIAVANLTTASPFRPFDITWPRPVPGQTMPRYFKLVYTVATGPMLTGAITSTLVLDRQDVVYYPAGINVQN